jgi:hypothetical protein
MKCFKSFFYNFDFEFDYRVLSRRLRVKHFTEAKILDDQERHLALEMPTSEMAHAGREREITHLQNNIKPKAEHLKLSKTDPSKWP